jgi:hypothetical protein
LDEDSDRELMCDYSPFCVPAKVAKLMRLKNKSILSQINVVTFDGTQNVQ